MRKHFERKQSPKRKVEEKARVIESKLTINSHPLHNLDIGKKDWFGFSHNQQVLFFFCA